MGDNERDFKATPGEISLDQPPLVDLRNYDVANHDRGRSTAIVLLWWLVQAIAFPLSLHNLNGESRWPLRLFGAKIARLTKV